MTTGAARPGRPSGHAAPDPVPGGGTDGGRHRHEQATAGRQREPRAARHHLAMQPDPAPIPSLMEQIQETYEHLDGWRARSRRLEAPQPGSEMHGDDAIWPGMPPSEVTRVSLMSGVQHLNLARTALEHGELFPMAHPTVLRGALLSSARAVWMLAPDDQHARQQRALRTIHETHRRQLEFGRSGTVEIAGPDPDGTLEYLEGRVEQIRKLWREMPDLGLKRGPSETSIVAAAADAALPTDGKRATVRSLWMQLSGDAHGLPWPMLTRPSTRAAPLPPGAVGTPQMAEFSAGGDLEEIAEGFLAAYALLHAGWSLFDQRCKAP